MYKLKVTINWHGEVHEFYTHAPSGQKALTNACQQLAKKLGLKGGVVRNYIMDGRDRYSYERSKSND